MINIKRNLDSETFDIIEILNGDKKILLKYYHTTRIFGCNPCRLDFMGKAVSDLEFDLDCLDILSITDNDILKRLFKLELINSVEFLQLLVMIQ